MKVQRIVYWITTVLFSFWMTLNGYAYLFEEEARRICAHFGFPDYFRVELAIAKLIGVAVLLLPVFNIRLKEWAYAGFVITVVSGFIAHLSSGDSLRSSASVLLALHLLLASYFTYHKLQTTKKQQFSH
jgi:VIT1/CCC1 family predicted Fe2+/Mn2+ transporter